MSFEIIFVLICCGCFASFMSAIFGVGGGVFLVPILMTIFPQMVIQQVSATSLSIVVGTATINLIYFLRQKIKINVTHLIFWSLGMIVGVQSGFVSSFYASKEVIVGVFVCTMLLLSIKTFLTVFKQKKNQKLANQNNQTKVDPIQINAINKEQESKFKNKDRYIGTILCTFGGAVAGFTGVGGGSVLAPLINQLKSVQHNQIAVYTNYMMIIGGLGSMYSYLTNYTENVFENTIQIGYINFNIISIVLLSSFLTSFVSVKLRKIIPPYLSILGLAIVLLVIACYSTYLMVVS